MAALEWFVHKALGDSVFWIQERFYESGNRANIWLVPGSHQDLVIDTGLGLRSLPDYLSAAGLLPHGMDGGSRRRPLMAVATHVHFDHAGGLRQFEQVAVHRDKAEALIRGDNFETVMWLSACEVVKPPTPGLSASQYTVQAVTPATSWRTVTPHRDDRRLLLILASRWQQVDDEGCESLICQDPTPSNLAYQQILVSAAGRTRLQSWPSSDSGRRWVQHICLLFRSIRGGCVVPCGGRYQKTASSANEDFWLPTPISADRRGCWVSDPDRSDMDDLS